MKHLWFHMMSYRDLPDDFRQRYQSVWVNPPNDELCDPETAGKYFNWNMDELELADDLGFDGIGTNEHHQNGYGFPVSPHMIGGIMARRKSDAAICLLGSTLPGYQPMRVAEELAVIDCMSGGRLIAGMPVGSAQDVVCNMGIPPTQVRPRYYEAHDLIKAAWTKPGPFPFNGKFNKLRYVNPWPKPIQKPHPPIWLGGGGSVETYHFAAANNYAYNCLTFYGYKSALGLMKEYWDVVGSYGLDDNPYRAGLAQIIFVADTDAQAENLYRKHLRNFFDKARYIPPHFSTVPGYMTRNSFEARLMKGGSVTPFAMAKEVDADWRTILDQGVVIAGSPQTVADRLIEAVKELRIGHLICLMQIQSMHPELTAYSTKLYAEKVMPQLAHIWDGYEDHWWPAGASRGPRRAKITADTKMKEQFVGEIA